MNEELQLAVMGYIVATKKQPKSEQEINTIAQQVIQLKQQDPQQYRQLVQLGQQAKQQMTQQQSAGVKAKLGSKLNYINKLKGNCPEGEELVYMKQGGRVCPACQKKAEKAKDGKKLPEKNAVADFKEKRKHINPNDTINTKFGTRDLNGKTKFPKWDPKKENYTPEERHRVLEKDQNKGKKLMVNACGSKMKKK